MKQYNFKFFTLLMAMFAASALMAQEHAITGLVTDAASGETIIGATITEVGTTNAIFTDFDGKFQLNLTSPNAVIAVTFIGYKRETVSVNGQTNFDIKLSQEAVEVDEIVVVGYGTQKKKVTTGAIASVDAEKIASTPVLRVDQAMQGLTAGVQVTNQSGQPGEAPTIRIRGAGTTGNASPLYVVDGMVVGSIDYLNPGDIKSMDVLKDAASAAIYGARAANGVVLITTKTGEKGGMSVTYSGYQGYQNVSKKLEMLDADQYRTIMNEGARNAGLTEPFDMNEVLTTNTNWQNEIFQKNAPIMSHELSVSGGNETSTYASSISYFSQDGIIGGDKSNFERFTARLNANNQVNKFFKFGTSLAYTNIKSRGIASNSSFNGVYSSALNLDPLTPVYVSGATLEQDPYASEPVVTNADGQVYGISEYVGAEVVNPLALLETQTGKTRADKLIGNAYAEIEFFTGLKLRTSGGIDLAYVTYDSYRPLFYLNAAQLNVDKTSVSKSIDKYFTWQFENVLTYTKSVNNHNFSALIGTTANKYKMESLSGFNADVPVNDPDNVYLNMAKDTLWTAGGGATHSALLSQFARVTYDFRSKYAFTGIIRRDGSSKFGANKRYGIFPSAGVSWAISDEAFMPSLGPVEMLKLRASWGVNGNQEIGDYQFISTMDNSRGYLFGGGREIGASPAYIENADIHWEESEQIDIALDMGAFDNRLQATVDFYRKTTSGLLERIAIPAHVGNYAPFANVGSVQNQGVEISLNWTHRMKELNYSIGFNASYNQNKMLEIGNEEGVLPGASWAIAGTVTRAEEGLPIAYFWGYKTDGIFQSETEVFQHIGSTGDPLQPKAVPGDVRFVDENGDGVLNEKDRTIIGNPTPDWTMGLNASVDYKNFDFSFLLSSSIGNDIFNGAQRQDLTYTNRTTAILERWTPENPSETVPRYTWSDINNNYRISDLYIEDGSYVRVKNIQLGYNLPITLLNKIASKKLRVYFSVENLYTFTKYTGADPEIGAISSFDIGIDRGIYPQARTFRVGTTLTF